MPNREKARLGDGCTNTAADKPNISAKVEQCAGRTVWYKCVGLINLKWSWRYHRLILHKAMFTQLFLTVTLIFEFKPIVKWIMAELLLEKHNELIDYVWVRLTLTINRDPRVDQDVKCVFWQINWNACSFAWAMQKQMNNYKTLSPSSFPLCSSSSPAFRRVCERK